MEIGVGVEDFNRCCRCCLAMVNDMKPLFGAYLNVMLTKLMNLQLAPMDGYPQQMCSRCILKLSSAYTFYTTVLKNQTRLVEILKAAECGDIPATVSDYSEKTELNTAGKEVIILGKENSVCEAACIQHFIPKGTTTPNQNSTSRIISPSVNDERQLQSETEISSENEESHQCSQCEHSSKNEEELKTHLETHLGAESLCKVEADVYAQLCNICGARFRWRTSLHKHLRQHRARRACAHCDKTFAEASTLKVHLVSHSLEPRPHRCWCCARGFTQRASRDRHARRHGGGARPRLPCRRCDKSFLHKYSLHRHQESTHSLHECTVCKKLFTGKKVLDAHMRLHEKEEMDCSNTEMPIDNTVTESISIQTVTVEFLCLLCTTKFQTRESLEVHICAKENIA